MFKVINVNDYSGLQVLMSIQKTNQLSTIAWGSTICTTNLNVDDNEGVQDNGYNSLEDYALNNSKVAWWFIPRCLKLVYEHVAYD
jgi:hypothetical protein